jgi:hypothetical protein
MIEMFCFLQMTAERHANLGFFDSAQTCYSVSMYLFLLQFLTVLFFLCSEMELQNVHLFMNWALSRTVKAIVITHYSNNVLSQNTSPL